MTAATSHRREFLTTLTFGSAALAGGLGRVEAAVTSPTGTGSISYGRIAGALQTLQAVIENELAPVVQGARLSQIRKTYERRFGLPDRLAPHEGSPACRAVAARPNDVDGNRRPGCRTTDILLIVSARS